jgi:hypothetical protein
MEYFTEVDTIPRGLQKHHYRYDYEIILKQFLESKVKFARLNQSIVPQKSSIDPHHNTVQCLKRTARRLKLPVKVISRLKEVYLIRD